MMLPLLPGCRMRRAAGSGGSVLRSPKGLYCGAARPRHGRFKRGARAPAGAGALEAHAGVCTAQRSAQARVEGVSGGPSACAPRPHLDDHDRLAPQLWVQLHLDCVVEREECVRVGALMGWVTPPQRAVRRARGAVAALRLQRLRRQPRGCPHGWGRRGRTRGSSGRSAASGALRQRSHPPGGLPWQ
jgi:hypothetical protein